MNRTFILVLGAIAWTIAAIDAAAHLVNGDVLVPAGMGLIFVAWLGLRRKWLHTHAAVPVPVETR